MKKSIIKFGIYSTAFLLLANLLSLLIYGTDPAYYNISEITGYSSIVLSMIFVYFGIREYRDKHLDGNLKFFQSLLIGLAIALFPAVLFGFYHIIYSEIIDPQFMDKYFNHQLKEMKANLTPAQFAKQKESMELNKELFANPLIQFFVMFFTVWVVGLIASIASSIILSTKKSIS